MSDSYFSMFPIINYNGTQCRNITERVKIDVTQNPSAAPTSYYPYTIANNNRPDQVAYYYYQTPQVDWLIYLTNGITDPYYDWYLGAADFADYITLKYGSIALAQQLIAFYRNNWPEDSTNISVGYYNGLPATSKKYYVPVFGQSNNIQSYARAQQDWTVSTNMIMQFTIDITNQTFFANNELITIYNNLEPTGSCQLIGTDTTGTILTVQSVSGNTGVGNTIIGTVSNGAGIITTSIVLQQLISNAEYVFWEPVYFYDLENEKNQKNQSIYLLDAGQMLPVIQNINTALQS